MVMGLIKDIYLQRDYYTGIKMKTPSNKVLVKMFLITLRLKKSQFFVLLPLLLQGSPVDSVLSNFWIPLMLQMSNMRWMAMFFGSGDDHFMCGRKQEKASQNECKRALQVLITVCVEESKIHMQYAIIIILGVELMTGGILQVAVILNCLVTRDLTPKAQTISIIGIGVIQGQFHLVMDQGLTEGGHTQGLCMGLLMVQGARARAHIKAAALSHPSCYRLQPVLKAPKWNRGLESVVVNALIDIPIAEIFQDSLSADMLQFCFYFGSIFEIGV
ncbi:hypothetical protein Nepgr_010070 [Nepenthes gracilis]|uniref:Uncharacterized protein n=1 Tax=Nepenthes gracilis TaxID=150966 RepID=A0AAD3SCI1_NEPGR|nr:hypothetical protein Nepgr_010070 [Nepenthes gracilis]